MLIENRSMRSYVCMEYCFYWISLKDMTVSYDSAVNQQG